MAAQSTQNTENRSVHQRLLESEWNGLPAAIRRLHRSALARQFSGRCRVERGSHFMSRLVARVMGFPAAADDVPITVKIRGVGPGEVWLRDFDGEALLSQLSVMGDLLIERMGPAALCFRLVPSNGVIGWQLISMKVFGMPVPRWLHARIEAHETADGDRYFFSARAEYKWLGLLVHYHGWLDVRE